MPLPTETAQLLKSMLDAHNQGSGEKIKTLGDYVHYLATKEVKRSSALTELRPIVTASCRRRAGRGLAAAN